MFNGEYGDEFLKGVAKGAGAIAIGLLYKTNILGSLFFGIFCCDYCRKTPEELREELREEEHKEKLMRGSENTQRGTSLLFGGVSHPIRRRREAAKQKLEEMNKYIKEYEEEDARRAARIKIKWN